MTTIVETISGLRSEISNISSNGQDDDLIIDLALGDPFTATAGDFVTGSDGHETLFVINIDDGDDLTIQGGGATLDAGGYGRLFEIQNGQVKLHNMTLTNGHLAGDGGNASVSSGGGNGESALGAGLRNGSDDGVTLLDVDFINNKATGGGGASEDAGGGGGAGAPGVSGLLGGDGGESAEGANDGENGTVSGGGGGAPIGSGGGRGGTTSGGAGGAGPNYDGGFGGTAEDSANPVIGGGGGGAPINLQSHHGGAGGHAAGAIFNDTSAQLTVIGSAFQSNYAAGGGGAGSNNGYDGGAGGSAAGAIWNDGSLFLGFRGDYSISTYVNDGVGGEGGKTNTTSDGTDGAPGGSGKVLGASAVSLVESVTSIDSTTSNGTFTAGDTIDIDVTFTNPVTLTDGSLNLMLDTGATVSIAPFGPQRTATGTYTVSSGETSGDLTVVGMAVDSGAVFQNPSADPARDVIPIPPSHNNLGDNKDLVIDGGSGEEEPPPPPPPGPTARGDTIEVVAGEVTGDLTQTLLSNDSNTNRIGGINNNATTGRVLTNTTEGGIHYEASGFASLAGGEEGTDSFRYRALNNNGSDSARVTVRVEGRNDAPTAGDLSVSGGENETLRVDLRDALSDPDNGDTPELAEVLDVRVAGLDATAPEGGWTEIDGDDLVFTPGDALDALAEDDAATVAIDYAAEDGAAARDTGTLTIDVTGSNDAPRALADGPVSTREGTTLTLEVADFATDPDRGETLRLEALEVTAMTGLDATLFDPASLSFDAAGATLESGPAIEALGADQTAVLTLGYTVRDDNDAAAEGTLDVEIQGVNDAPVAADDSRTVGTEAIAASGDVLANDSDPDAEATLEVVAVNGDEAAVGTSLNLESGASLRLNADGGYVYQPGDLAETLAPDSEAVETVTYTLADETGATAQASLAITVTAPAEAPQDDMPEPDEPRQPAGGRDGDFISGSAGADVVQGGPLGDELQGGAGRDTVLANAEEDLDESTGRDLLNGGSGPDKLIGDAGDDEMFGGADPDALLGGGGNDSLDGGDGNDILFGEAGDDRLSGGRGQDFLQGGPGNDTFLVGAGQGLVAIGDFTPGDDVLDVSDYVGALDFEVIQEAAVQDGFATEIDLGGTMIRMLNVQVTTLDAEDFIFG